MGVGYCLLQASSASRPKKAPRKSRVYETETGAKEKDPFFSRNFSLAHVMTWHSPLHTGLP